MLVEDFYKADADADTGTNAECLVESSTSMLLEMMVLDDCHVKAINQCLCMPKAELKTKNEVKRPPLCGLLGSFLVFNSVH